MAITRQTVANKVVDYLQHRIAERELVDWAERAIMASDFDRREPELLRDIVGRLGLADVQAFGLTWNDCEDVLRQLGYTVRLTVEAQT